MEQDKFLMAQNLAFQAAEFAAGQLQEEMTEIEASELMSDYLQKAGVRSYFHFPFAWFGDRSCFKNFQKPLTVLDDKSSFFKRSTFSKIFSPKEILPHLGQQFMPQKIKLKKNTAVILDVAPVVDGVFADIGYSTFFGEMTENYIKALAVLSEIRKIIPELINQGLTNHAVYTEVEKIFKRNHFSNRHSLYPLGVLGHKVGELPLNWLPSFKVMGFQMQAFMYVLSKELPWSKPNASTPFLREGVDFPIIDGMWAVEPHLGNEHWGAKFEEILVIKEGKAKWLNPTAPSFLNTARISEL